MPSPSALPAALLRGAVFFGLWLVLTGAEHFGLPFGLIAAFCATLRSLRLLPPSTSRIAPGGLPRLAPGIIEVPLAIPPGPSRDAFRALASLAPGSLPLEDVPDGRLRLHALDLAMPLEKDLAETEAALARSIRTDKHG
ncbi:MAG: hypothetical protein ACKO4X_22680 [Alphaproteobacteria bacterium]